MTKAIIQYIFKCVLLILAQAVIFNNIVLFNAVIPFVFIYIIISMPLTWGVNIALTIGFFTGLSVDIFANTLGVNALACTILAFARRPIFYLYMQRDDDLSGLKPSQRSMGSGEFMKYASTMTLLYCTLAFGIDAFAVFSPWRLCLQIVGSTIFTTIIIYAFDSIFTRQNEKR